MNKRHFTAKEIEKLKDKYPAVLRLKCHCPKRHRSGCGCMTEMFVKVARKNFSRALHDAGTDPDKFKKRMTALHHHARDIHGWEVTEGGTTVQQFCDFHPLFVCSCGSCKKDELTCEGKLYHTSYVLSCRFHALLYKIECDNRSARASDLIHPVFGKGHTSRMESAHSILTVFRPKSWHLFRLHYEVSTNLALLQSNVNYMNSVCGMNYHWLSDLYQRLSIPILEGMEAVLKQVNVRRIKESQQGKTEASKKRRLRCYKKHLGEEQLARQKFGKSLKMSHTYGKTEKLTDDSPRSSLVKAECQTTPSRQVSANEKACRCGSTRHNRRECPFNKQLKKPAFFSGHDDSCHVVEQHASHHNSPLAQTVEEPAVSTVCDSFDDTDDDNQPPQSVPVKAKSRSSPASTNQQPCKCGSTLHSRINHRDCPLNKKLKKPSAHDDGCHVDDRQSSRHDNRKSKKKAAVSSEHDSCGDDDDVGSSHIISDDDSVDYQQYSHLFTTGDYDFGDCDSKDEVEAWSDEDLSSDDELLSCNCVMGYKGTHERDCPFNPRKKRERCFSSLPTCNLSSECEMVDVSDSSFQPSGPLPSSVWKQRACEMVEQWSLVSLISESEPVKAIKCKEILPHVRDSVIGDGHCLFRAISKEITGTQKNHRAMRLAVKNFLTDTQNAELFGRWLFQINEEKNEDPVSKVAEYVKNLRSGAWGSDKEITVAATMFQVDIMVYSQFGRQGRKWLKFSPAFSNHNCTIPSTGLSLHLYHTRSLDHYDRVVLHLAE